MVDTKILGGWDENAAKDVRRRKALISKPKNWKLKTRYKACAKSLQSISNSSKNIKRKIMAHKDARYFLKMYKK